MGMSGNSNYELVIVANGDDINIVVEHANLYHKNLCPSKIVIVCPASVSSEIKKKIYIPSLEFFEENDIFPGLSLNSVRSIITKRGGDGNRAGWYLQQFLKMAYAFTSTTPEYLIWDADTIPLNHLNYYTGDGKPIFTVKNEYHKPYFSTLEKLLGYGKQIQTSFIAEHMLINKYRMLELISTIESNNSLFGKAFFEKVIYAVNQGDLSGSGFSEFETYGSFILYNYPSTYSIKRLRTARHAKIVLGNHPSESALTWFSKCYDTLSLEKWDSENSILKSISQNRTFQYLVPASIMYNIALVLSRLKFVLDKIFKPRY